MTTYRIYDNQKKEYIKDVDNDFDDPQEAMDKRYLLLNETSFYEDYAEAWLEVHEFSGGEEIGKDVTEQLENEQI